jgi:hypothetical protein
MFIRRHTNNIGTNEGPLRLDAVEAGQSLAVG